MKPSTRLILRIVLQVAAGSQLGVAAATPRPDVPPRHVYYECVNSPNTPPALRTIDEEAAKHGADKTYFRNVSYVTGMGYEYTEKTARGRPETLVSFAWAVVDYRPDVGMAGAGGLQVWIERDTGKRFIIPRRFLHTADLTAVREGYDLTQYRRSVLREEAWFRIVYSLIQKPREVIHAEFTVLLDALTGERVR